MAFTLKKIPVKKRSFKKHFDTFLLELSAAPSLSNIYI